MKYKVELKLPPLPPPHPRPQKEQRTTLKKPSLIRVNANEIWMNGNWFYMAEYSVFDDGRKATQRSPPDKPRRWIISQSKSFTRDGIGKARRCVKAFVYLFLLLKFKQDRV